MTTQATRIFLVLRRLIRERVSSDWLRIGGHVPMSYHIP